MIEIITASGVSLDIDPSTEFEIEIENPVFSDSHIPIPFSTSISFLPTAKNKKVFGYMAAMLQEPSEKKISVSIYAGGIPLFYGRLEYESVEDNKLNYTFAGRNVEDEWGGYIHELGHLSKLSFPNEPWGLLMTEKSYQQLLGVQNGSEELDFALPMLINQDSVIEMEHDSSSSMTNKEHYDICEIKYHNYFWGLHLSPVTPAVKVKSILSGVFHNITIEKDIQSQIENLAIPALHRSRPLCRHGLQQNSERKLVLPIADMLPECTIFRLVSNILKMYCSVMFRDGQGFVIKRCDTILRMDIKHVWDKKISKNVSISKEGACSYTFAFSNDNDNVYKTDTEDAENDSITDVLGLKEVINTAESASGEYIAIRDNKTGNMYSGKSVSVKRSDGTTNTATLCSLDIILHHLDNFSPKQEEAQSFDNTIDFKCVKCLPLHHAPFLIDSTAYHNCPIVKPSAAGDNRPTDVIIGCLFNGQLVDKGVAFVPQYKESNGTILRYGNDDEQEDKNYSIDPNILYQRYHSTFADWLSKDRRVITTDVALSLYEIAALRMYDKVSVYNQPFLIKKISHKFSTRLDSVESRAELIECSVGSTNIRNIAWIESWKTIEGLKQFKIVSQYPVESDIVVKLPYIPNGESEDNELQYALLKVIKGGTCSNIVNGNIESTRVQADQEIGEDSRYIYILKGIKES